MAIVPADFLTLRDTKTGVEKDLQFMSQIRRAKAHKVALGLSELQQFLIKHKDQLSFPKTPKGLASEALSRISKDGLESADFQLHREYDETFTKHGDLVKAGFWLDLNVDQLKGLKINGEETALVSRSDLQLEMAYRRNGFSYDPAKVVVSELSKLPRDLVMEVIDWMLSVSNINALPPAHIAQELAKHDTPISGVIKNVIDNHKVVARQFFRGIGPFANKSCIDIMLCTTHAAHDAGIVALPVNKGLIVPVSKEAEVEALLTKVLSQYSQGTLRNAYN